MFDKVIAKEIPFSEADSYLAGMKASCCSWDYLSRCDVCHAQLLAFRKKERVDFRLLAPDKIKHTLSRFSKYFMERLISSFVCMSKLKYFANKDFFEFTGCFFCALNKVDFHSDQPYDFSSELECGSELFVKSCKDCKSEQSLLCVKHIEIYGFFARFFNDDAFYFVSRMAPIIEDYLHVLVFMKSIELLSGEKFLDYPDCLICDIKREGLWNACHDKFDDLSGFFKEVEEDIDHE